MGTRDTRGARWGITRFKRWDGGGAKCAFLGRSGGFAFVRVFASPHRVEIPSQMGGVYRLLTKQKGTLDHTTMLQSTKYQLILLSKICVKFMYGFGTTYVDKKDRNA